MKRIDWILLLAVSLASSAWCLTASRQIGATFDEPFYLEAGLSYWRDGHFGQLLAAGVMPLAAHLHTLPVYIAEQSAGRAFTIQQDLGLMLQLARPVTLLFWIVLLAYAMRLGRLWGGPTGGRLALAIVAIEPNFLAHASLATTDIALAACFVAFVAHYLEGRHASGSLRRIWVPAIWLALSIAAKVSALALLPFAAIVALHQERHDAATFKRLVRDTALIVTLGLALAVIYCGTGGQTWLHGTLAAMPADHWLRPTVAWVGSLPVFPNGLYAVAFQFAHNQGGQPVFIAGMAGTEALWSYVPLVLSIKLAVPLIAIVVLAVVTHPARTAVALIGLACVGLAVLVFRVQTGIRFLLPLLVLVIAWSGARTATLAGSRFSVRAGIAALLTALALESAFAWPDALRYVNVLWGGTTNGYRVASDSNYDWGQGLPELDAWRRANGASMAVWYFGTDTRFPEIVRYNPRTDSADVMDGRLLAVSTSLLFGGYLETPDAARALADQLRSVEPVARTRTFFIFAPPR